MLYMIAFIDEVNYKEVPVIVAKMIQEFPAHNAYHPIKHNRFEDITSLLKQERTVFKATDVHFGNTDLVSLTESWKLMTALFQLLFVITAGGVFPSDLEWGRYQT